MMEKKDREKDQRREEIKENPGQAGWIAGMCRTRIIYEYTRGGSLNLESLRRGKTARMIPYIRSTGY
jgi:hypothetical protein